VLVLADCSCVVVFFSAFDYDTLSSPTSNQKGCLRLDKFTHCLLTKCNVEVLDILLTTLIREMQASSCEKRMAETRLASHCFVRSVVRVYVVLSMEMQPQSSKSKV
jgi:E3 ubiquitin-protein ligase EDD1